jgi:hypothetical protein
VKIKKQSLKLVIMVLCLGLSSCVIGNNVDRRTFNGNEEMQIQVLKNLQSKPDTNNNKNSR